MKRLRIKAYTPICKTENGATGTTSRMLKLDDYIKLENSNKNIQLRLIKGLKGWLRHKYMEYYQKKGIEVCYSSSKENFKDRKIEIPKGFHLLGDCNGKCPIYNIFGGVSTKKDVSNELSRPSKIKVWANPIISEARFKSQKETVKKLLRTKFNIVSFNVENGVALGQDDVSLQQFGKEFFSGNFEIFIDVKKLNEEELKNLLEILLTTNTQLGGSKTYGNGIINIKKIEYEEVNEKIVLEKNGEIIREEIIEKLELPRINLTTI